jgi:TonB family protein
VYELNVASAGNGTRTGFFLCNTLPFSYTRVRPFSFAQVQLSYTPVDVWLNYNDGDRVREGSCVIPRLANVNGARERSVAAPCHNLASMLNWRTSLAAVAWCVVFTGPAVQAAQDPSRTLKPEIEAELGRFVVEGSSGSPTGFRGDLLHVKADGGWARTRRIVSDFLLKAEVRLMSPRAEPQVGFRTINTEREWPRRGYWLRLSSAQPVTVEARGYDLEKPTAAQVKLLPADWQTVTIKGIGPAIEVAVNGQALGSYAIDTLAGSILFQTHGGDAEVRNIDLQLVPPSGLTDPKAHKARGEFVMPRLMRETKPRYSRDAMDANVQGVIQLEAVILADGSIGGVGLRSLLHPELEHCALEAIRKWQFVPALLNGSPVSMIVDVEMSFHLRK